MICVTIFLKCQDASEGNESHLRDVRNPKCYFRPLATIGLIKLITWESKYYYFGTYLPKRKELERPEWSQPVALVIIFWLIPRKNSEILEKTPPYSAGVVNIPQLRKTRIFGDILVRVGSQGVTPVDKNLYKNCLLSIYDWYSPKKRWNND